MLSSTYSTLAEALKQIRKESPRQFSVCEAKDETGEWVVVYSRPTEFAKI